MACDVAWQPWLKPSNSTAETAKLAVIIQFQSHHSFISLLRRIFQQFLYGKWFSQQIFMENCFSCSTGTKNAFICRSYTIFLFPKIIDKVSCGNLLLNMMTKIFITFDWPMAWWHASYWYFAPGKFCGSISEWRLYQLRSALCQILRCPHRGGIYPAV